MDRRKGVASVGVALLMGVAIVMSVSGAVADREHLSARPEDKGGTGNPHFVGRVRASLDGTSVVVSWKEAGLGNNQVIDYVASANATATFDCVNNGGNCPNAANKHSVEGPVSAAGTFSSGKNGQITQSLTIDAPGAGDFTCPGGQTLTLSALSYSEIQIEDTTNGVSAGAVPSALSATYFTCP